MVANMSVGVGGINEIIEQLKNGVNEKKEINNHLNNLVELKKIEVTDEKPDIMFLYELLDFLESLPVWDTSDVKCFTDDETRRCVCFVSPKWNGRVEVYHDYKGICNIKSVEGEIHTLDVDYYINKLYNVLNYVYGSG